MKSRTGDALLLELRNYLSSYQESGDGKLNLDRALLLLKEKKKEWQSRMQIREQQQEAEEKKIKFEIAYLERETEELHQKLLEEQKREKAGEEELRREEQRQEELRREEQRDVYKRQGYKSKEIGLILHKNHNTVRSRLNRALKKMEEILQLSLIHI